MIAIALFRNLNLGQAGTPRSRELVDLFGRHGADDARSVRSNGTIVLRAEDPVAVAERVRARVVATSSWSDVVILREAAWMEALASRLLGCAPTTEVAFYDAPVAFPKALPWRPDRGRITVEHADERHAVCVDDEPRTSFATRVLERLLDVPVTSRGAETVVRTAAAAQGLHSDT